MTNTFSDAFCVPYEQLSQNDYSLAKILSPYANWKEKDIIANLSDTNLIQLIRASSYYQKHLHPLNIHTMKRWELKKCYYKCRNYATRDIIDALYPVDQLENSIQHIDCATEKFYILSRVRTEFESPTIEENAATRTYLSFTLSSHLNLSHYPGKVWFGYRTGITPDMIGLIYPHDADTRSWARNRQELGAWREILVDHEDLEAASVNLNTYSQLSIKASSTTTHTPITPDCILCIDNVDDESLRTHEEQALPVLILHPSHQTICHIHDFCETNIF